MEEEILAFLSNMELKVQNQQFFLEMLKNCVRQ